MPFHLIFLPLSFDIPAIIFNFVENIFYMNTLFIHGLDSFPTPDIKEAMKTAGLNVTALHLNYREKLGVYETLKDTAIHKNAEFIIGCHLGGYLASVLADDLGLPCLLFNPEMNYTDVFYSKIPVIEHSKCPARFAVLGCQDASINPTLTKRNFEEQKGDTDQRIITCQWLGHDVDLRTFDEMLHWALYHLKKEK